MTIDISKDFKNKIKDFTHSNGEKLRDFVLESLRREIEESNST